MEADGGAGREAGSRQRCHAGLSVLASAAIRGAESAAGCLQRRSKRRCCAALTWLDGSWRRALAALLFTGAVRVLRLIFFSPTDFRLREQVQIVGAAGFRIGA